MLQKPLNPDLFNIDLLIPDAGYFKKLNLKEVTTLAIFETNSNVFHEDGLYSPSIFGPIGSNERLKRHGYVDFVVPVLHPLVYKTITELGKKYEKIISGSAYGYFDKTINDFVIDDTKEESQTGFEFFIKHLDKIKYGTTSSSKRDYKIALVNKYGRSDGLYTTSLVLPAGLRDYTVDEKGVPSEDEINDKYRLLIGLANRVKNFRLTKDNIYLLDPIRYKIQRVLLDIYLYFKAIIDGKNKFIQAKFASRGIDYATANVITATPVLIKDLEQTNKITFNHTVIGLYQYLKSIGTLIVNKINSYFLYDIISETSVRLIDPKTLQSTIVELSNKTRTNWLTIEGINGIVNKMQQDTIKDSPVLLDGYYIALVDNREDKVVVYTNTQDIPPEVDKTKLTPITYGEMFYICIIDISEKYPSLNTRYPITGAGSIYPVYNFVKVTAEGREVDVEINNTILRAKWYPEKGSVYFRSQSPHFTHLALLGADYDGDRNSLTTLLTKESIEEVEKLLNSKEYYLDPVNGLQYSVNIIPINLTIKHLTEGLSGKVKTESNALSKIGEMEVEKENGDIYYLVVEEDKTDELEAKIVFSNLEEKYNIENVRLVPFNSNALATTPIVLKGTPIASKFLEEHRDTFYKNYKIIYPDLKDKELELLIEKDIIKLTHNLDKSYANINFNILKEILKKPEYVSYTDTMSFADKSMERFGVLNLKYIPHLVVQLNKSLEEITNNIELKVGEVLQEEIHETESGKVVMGVGDLTGTNSTLLKSALGVLGYTLKVAIGVPVKKLLLEPIKKGIKRRTTKVVDELKEEIKEYKDKIDNLEY